MNAETLERLILDRALGALDADVAALLDAHLRDNPAAAAEAAAIERTMARVRAATRTNPPINVPPFPLSQAAAVRQRARVIRISGWFTGLAACLLLGVGVGAWWKGTAMPTGPMLVVGPAPEVQPLADLGMWSESRRLAAALEARRSATSVMPARELIRKAAAGGGL
ncbi:hypothetical protein RAS1_10340 [Phycisphaerae bacterium RAS1]|nr:hypothetical protein RAS1_10340 [Phycisphaerae bacterium RAS1]